MSWKRDRQSVFSGRIPLTAHFRYSLAMSGYQAEWPPNPAIKGLFIRRTYGTISDTVTIRTQTNRVNENSLIVSTRDVVTWLSFKSGFLMISKLKKHEQGDEVKMIALSWLSFLGSAKTDVLSMSVVRLDSYLSLLNFGFSCGTSHVAYQHSPPVWRFPAKPLSEFTKVASSAVIDHLIKY